MADIAELILKADSTDIRKAAADLEKLSQSSARTELAVSGFATSAARGLDFVKTSVGGLVAAFAGLSLGGLVREAAQLSQRYAELGVVLDTVSRNSGLVKSEVDSVTAALTKQGISMIQSRQVMAQMIQANIDLSKATQLARLAQDAAVIGQINSSEALQRMIFGITSSQVEILRGIGINVNFEQSYKKLAGEIGKTSAALTEQEKLQARVNIVLNEAPKLMGVYEASMSNAGKQMRSTERIIEDLKVKLGGLFDETSRVAVTSYTDLLKDLDAQLESMAKSGELKDWSHRIAIEFAGLIDATKTFTGSLGILFKMIETGFGQIATGNFQGLTATFINADNALKALWADSTKYQDQVNHRVIVESMLTDKVTGQSNAVRKLTGETNTLIDAKERKIKADVAEIHKLKEYQDQMAAMRSAEYQKLKAHEDLLERARDITQSVATKQEIYNQTLEELNRLKPHLSVETYTRALQKAEDELNDVSRSTRKATDEVSQLWIQAGRNIQNALGNMVFDFFNGGLNDMVRNVKSAVLRIASEFAGLKIAQTLGLTSLFAIPGMAGASTTAAASGGLGLSGMLNIGSMGTSLMSMFKGGFGSMGVIGSAIGGLGSLTGSSGLAAFGGGLAGDAIGGLAAGGFTSGAASAASMGSAFAAAAGPLMAAFLTTQVAKMIAGDKRMGGGFGKALNFIGDIPVLGEFMAIVPVLNALFGRGPYKFRQQSLQGTASAGGFEGSITDVYRSKGGLFMGNKHKEFTNPLDSQMNQMFDQAIRAYSTSVRDFSENMGISTGIIDTWSKEVQIKSEKGKRLTEEAVAELIASFGDEMARSVIPEIDQLSKAGESAYQTLQRLNSEFESLANAATILGYSLAESSEMVRNATYEQRTAFIDLFGGLDAFNQQINYFMQNFLTPAERLAPMAEALGNELSKLGIVSSLTNEQFKALIQSYGKIGGINQAQLVGLMALSNEVFSVNQLRNQVTTTTDGLVASESNLVSLRQQLLAAYNKERGELEVSVSKFESISRTLRDFRDSLALSELSPLTPQQQLAEAARQFNLTRTQAAAGDQEAMAKLPTVAEQFLRASQTYNASSAAYISDFNMVQSVLANTADVALNQADIARQQLTQLQKSVTGIIDISDNTKTTNELLQQILDLQQQLGGASGGGTSGGATGSNLTNALQQLASMQAAGSDPIDLYNFAKSNNVTASQAAGALTGFTESDINQYVALNNLQPLSGNATGSLFANTATDQQILDYLATNPAPMDIYQKAIEYGVSSARLAPLMNVAQQDILDWVKANGLAAFETGTDYVPRTGIALLHKGEAVQPATMGDEIKALRAEIAEFRREQAKLMMDQNNVIAITNKQNAEVIVNSAKDNSRNENWHKQTTARVK
jgi:hypothetical protein